MPPKLMTSAKRLKINNANSVMVIAVAISSFIIVFSLVASNALLNQRSYQTRVITKKEEARDQLKKNVTASEPLIIAYKAFIGSTENVIGGNPLGKSDKDGDNAKIILDALPSKYDFPALATSLEKLLTQRGVKIDSITGTDDELAQGSQGSSSQPLPIDMPFEVSITGDYRHVQSIIGLFGKSIRPIQINGLDFSVDDSGGLQLTVKAKTYYQPAKDLSLKTEVVK